MFILNPRLAADIFDGEYIIANLDTGLYYSIQGLAVSLVQALPIESEENPIKKLAFQFDGKSKEIETELRTIWKQLIDEEIVKEGKLPVAANLDWIPATAYSVSHFNRYADMQDLLMLDPIHQVDEDGWPVKREE